MMLFVVLLLIMLVVLLVMIGYLAHRLSVRLQQLTEVRAWLKETQRTLTMTKNYTDNVIASIADALLVVNTAGIIERVNQLTCDLVGYQQEELLGQDVTLVFAETEPESRLQQLLSADLLQNHRMSWQTRTGERIRVSFSSAVVPSVQDNLTRIVCTARDITAQERIEEEVGRQALALETAASAIYITDTEGIFQWVNPAFTELTGYIMADVMGTTPRILKSGKQSSEVYQQLWKTIIAGQTWKGLMINRRKDGQEYTQDLTISAVRQEDDRVTGFVAVAQDVTARVKREADMERTRRVMLSVLEDTKAAKMAVERREKELQETQKMLVQAGKLTAMGQLGAGIAHELNQPIAAVRGFSQLLLSQLPPDSPMIPNLTLIEEQSQRMGKIVDNIRTFAREGIGEREPVNLNRVIDAALMLVTTQFNAHHIMVAYDADPQLPTVMADKNQMQQIFLNLFTNARDAIEETGQHGTITITTGAGTNGWVEARVRDTGAGMTDAVRDRLFDPFFTTKPPGKGTGLGLSILYGIIDKHGGRIDVESDLDKGTTFIVRLPVAHEVATAITDPHTIQRRAS